MEIISALKGKLAYLSQQQAVTSENIANKETPYYKRQYLEEPNFAKMVNKEAASLPMRTTRGAHISGVSNSKNYFSVHKDSSIIEGNLNGNNVVIEDEMLTMNNSQVQYQQTTQLYTKMMGLLKKAINNGGAGG